MGGISAISGRRLVLGRRRSCGRRPRSRMRVATPTVSWHNRERVASVDFQPVAYPSQTPNGTKSGYPTRLATAGDDKHVLVRTLVKLFILPQHMSWIVHFYCNASRTSPL